MKTSRPWMQTASGGAFHLLKPEPAEVDIRDIAEALAKLCRFNGHTQNFYSVAQHSCLVMDLCHPAAKPYGLLHDAHEAFTGDLIRPMHSALTAKAGYDIWQKVSDDIQEAVHRAFGLQWPLHRTVNQMVADADLVALATERRDLLSDGPNWEMALPAPDRQVIRPWTWAEAHHNFLERFRSVRKMHPEMALAMRNFGRGGIGA